MLILKFKKYHASTSRRPTDRIVCTKGFAHNGEVGKKGGPGESAESCPGDSAESEARSAGLTSQLCTNRESHV